MRSVFRSRSGSAAGAALVLLVSAAPAFAARFQVGSSLEPEVAAVGEAVRFTLQVQGPGFEAPRLRPRFELDNLVVVGGPNQRHSISMSTGSGGSGWSYFWTWWLAPQEVGTASVKNVYLLVGDQRIDLPARSLRVVSGPPPGGPHTQTRPQPAPRSPLDGLLQPSRQHPQDDRPDIFLRAVVSPTHPYVGQRVVYTLYLYTRVSVRDVELETVPTYQGFWARPLEVDPSRAETVELDGTLYHRQPLFCRELYAFAPRAHRLEPVRARFLIERIEQDKLFLTPVRVPVEVEVESNPLDLEVRPLPPPADSGVPAFSGAVGPLHLRAALTPAKVEVGQGASLELTAWGEGHLEALAAPELDLPRGVDLIGPQPVAATDDDGSTRTWRYLLVPRRPGEFPVPAVEMAYFDPEAAKYRVARTAIPDLVARPAESATAAGSGPPHAIRSAALPAPPDPVWRRSLPWAVALPSIATLVLVLVRRRPAARFALGRGAGGLPEFRERLRTALTEERPRRAAGTIERAWRDLLSRELGVAEVIPTASWPDELLERGLPAAACRELRGMLDDLHYLRFAPELSAIAALTGDLVSRSERLARDLLIARPSRT